MLTRLLFFMLTKLNSKTYSVRFVFMSLSLIKIQANENRPCKNIALTSHNKQHSYKVCVYFQFNVQSPVQA